MDLTVSYAVSLTDLFCGAGGSSTGATQVPGVRVIMAANHWQLAVDTHNANHPDTDHDCADVSQVDPRRYPRTDILWASPECTNHSIARGKKRDADTAPDIFGDTLPDEAAQRSRATMWDVVRFAEHHRYRAVIVENVVDAVAWSLWSSWLHAMDALGYQHRIVYANSMHAQAGGLPAPQSRDRLYVVFWRTGERAPDFDRWLRPRAWCPTCDVEVRAVQAWKKPDAPGGKYRSQYVWKCPNALCRNAVVEPVVLGAGYAIDWTRRGIRIGDRERHGLKRLSARTHARVEVAVRKFATPVHLEAAGNTHERRPGTRAWPVSAPLKTLHTTASKAVAVPPLMTPAGGTWNDMALPVGSPMRTRTTRDSDALVVPPLLVPVEGREGKVAAGVATPLRTMTTRNETALVVPPFIAELRGGGSSARLVSDPAATFTASGNHHALTVAGAWEYWAAVYAYDSGDLLDPRAQPLPTQTTVVGDAILTGDLDDLLPDVNDCELRMLEPYEAGRGMGLPQGYILRGNKREQMRLAGNAVCPPNARDLVALTVEALTGEQIEMAA